MKTANMGAGTIMFLLAISLMCPPIGLIIYFMIED